MENWADVVADRMVGTSPLRKGGPGSPDVQPRLCGYPPAARRRRYRQDDTDGRPGRAPGAASTGRPGRRRCRPVPHRPADDGRLDAAREGAGRARTSAPDAGGIAFVGDVTPVGHLLQLTRGPGSVRRAGPTGGRRGPHRYARPGDGRRRLLPLVDGAAAPAAAAHRGHPAGE